MKFLLCLSLISITIICEAQPLQKEKRYQNCKDKKCQIKESFLNAEYFLEEDAILSSQKWLDITKNLISLNKIDTTAVFVHSLQSELFYYNGLYQFGINEAEKAIKIAHILKT